MNALDAVVLLILALFAFRGFKNGFIKEALGLIGIIAACFIAFHYMGPLSEFLGNHISVDSKYTPYFSAIVLFLGTLIVVELVIVFLTKLLQAVALGLPNRILGLVLSMIKGGVIVSVILLVLAGFDQPSEHYQKESLLYSYVIALAPATYDAIAWVFPGIKNFEKTIQNTISNNKPTFDIPKQN